MSIELNPGSRTMLMSSIKRFVLEHLDEEIGDLKAELFLDFVEKEIGPTIYNQALSDARVYIIDRADDVEGSLSIPEFTYWKKK